MILSPQLYVIQSRIVDFSFLNEVVDKVFQLFELNYPKDNKNFYIAKEKCQTKYGFCKTDLDCIVLNKLSQYALAAARSYFPVSIIIFEKFANTIVAPNLRNSANNNAKTFCMTYKCQCN